ncbi:biotin-independent malonate decarboxylase subunit gamma [Neisseria leonii]|uniref:Biotin-independent malonate decarboxylase subunit gamma n=1 Tax=Neisseria leonii TaxID=2995413 RepID=A0A9X4E323_9NEIS|nr:biotin-independent malonate decarboxylase subunit gamma [Neisseria sp. 51.81]MDD9328702.1 biotin-independent malonate decarboxylase subunit gamma [Neisseria sp. 51.81]
MKAGKQTGRRGRIWFDAVAAGMVPVAAAVPSVLVASGRLGGRGAAVVAVVPDEANRFVRARNGEVGLLEGWALADAVGSVVVEDRSRTEKRMVVCIVDVPSQAYGRREEAFGIHQALAAAVDAYARARLAGHPVIALLVGKAMSGAFLAHGYQANRIIALDDPKVMVHAMGKEAAARITMRSVEQLEAWAAEIAPMAYDMDSYASLGLLYARLTVSDPDCPNRSDVQSVIEAVSAACDDVLMQADTGLSGRLNGRNREMTRKVRQAVAEQW